MAPEGQHRDQQPCHGGGQFEAALFANILAFDFDFGPPGHRRQQHQLGFAKTSVAKARQSTPLCPANINVKRLFAIEPLHRRWQTGRLLPVEIAGLGVPGDLAVGNNDQQSIGLAVVSPPLDSLATHGDCAASGEASNRK